MFAHGLGARNANVTHSVRRAVGELVHPNDRFLEIEVVYECKVIDAVLPRIVIEWISSHLVAIQTNHEKNTPRMT